MKSIQTKFIVLILSGLTALALVMGGFSIWIVNRVETEDARIMMNQTCREQALQLDSQLNLVEQAVTVIHGYAQRQLNVSQLTENKIYANSYTEKVRSLAVSIASHTDGAISVYFRYNPQFIGNGKGGFFFAREHAEGKFMGRIPTDILTYSASDEGYVGWYYTAVQAETGTWMRPYYNKNLKKEVITYVVPLYEQGQLIGVIGIDVDFSEFVTVAQDIRLYKTGKAQLACLRNKTLYYRGEGDAEISRNTLSERLYQEMQQETYTDALSEYVADGKKYMVSFHPLRNQMRLIVYAPTNEINAQRNYLISGCIILTIVIPCAMTLLSIKITRRIVLPLKELTVASERFARGEWDVSIQCDTQDEVKCLTDSITKMAAETQKYIKAINKMAYQDGLTGVKNKACYMDFVEALSASGVHEESEYAVLVLDVNGLKWVNDTYGHEMGDELIVSASRYICEIFSHSPVFRVGGDEFVVIMTDDECRKKEELLEMVRASLHHKIINQEKNIALSIASGLASYPADGENYEAIFRMADERMYQNKQYMKNQKSK